ncbi:hypothetical protein FNZ56_04130 [Pseudoluteimonas lycopersici]|uniref:Uncharacterized protein n=1 Tax=Pseudoluteimonas lycopersici TaxID=1324796 RepID=A0A516V3L0_9GAMM|nr:hypothetical protein [Lysobacter lycopersici]QDQ73118.1 hypothetical protein FNZ56_04130 [Lysobacter lycopersici]
MSYGPDFNAGWASARASAEWDKIWQARWDHMRASGVDPVRGFADLWIFCFIICGTAVAVYGVREWIHDMPFFLHHVWIKNAVYWTVGLCSYSLLFVLREFIRILMQVAFLAFLVWMACSFVFAML